MAFDGNAADISKLKMDTKTTLKVDVQIQSFEFQGAVTKNSENILKHIAAAAKAAQETNQSAGIRLDDFDMDFSGLTAGLGIDEPEDILLREVRALMAREEYQPALEKLDELFAIDEANHDGIYLKALCQTRLNKRIKALQTLRPMMNYQLNPRLQSRVQNLLLDIRSEYLPRAGKVYKQAVRAKDTEKAKGILDELVVSDPGCGQYHYFLAGLHVVDGNMHQGIEQAKAGINACDSGREELEEFCRSIEERFAKKELQPARVEFRRKQYRVCLVALESVAENAKGTVLFRTFYGYVERLASGSGLLASIGLKSKGKAVMPPGSLSDANLLYEFLVAPEMKNAQAEIEKSDYEAAELSLDNALDLVAMYPMANHLSANCVYRRVATAVKSHLGKDLNESTVAVLRQHESALRKAESRTTIACNDPEIRDAPKLAETIHGLTIQIVGALKEYDDRQNDAKLVNKAVEELLQTVLLLAGNMNNRDSIIRLFRSLQALDSNLPKKRKMCRTAEARDLMNQIRTIIKPLLQTLKTACNQVGIY